MPEISVIVPVYNVEAYLHRCVDSILAQTFTDFELILVDDGSPDNCPAICDEYAAQDQRVRVIHKENGGVSKARNAALDVAQGKYVAFCDSDDYVAKNYLERLYCPECDLSICGCYFCSSDGHVSKIARKEEKRIEEVSNQKIVEWFEHGSMYSVWCCLFNLDIIRSNDICFDTNTSRGEDTIFMFRYVECCKQVCFVEDILYYYVRYGGDTLTTTPGYRNIVSLGYLDCFLRKWFSERNLRSVNFDRKDFWTRSELKEQFIAVMQDAKMPIQQKYKYYREIWKQEAFREHVGELFESDSHKMKMLLHFKSAAVLCAYEVYNRVRR